MSKAQSFGFDLLMVIIIIILFGELLLIQELNTKPSLLMQRKVENAQLLNLLLVYNNSLSFIDSFLCNNNTGSLQEFNDSVEHVLNNYVNNREYLLAVNNLVYSSEGVNSVCLKQASPAKLNITSNCGTNLNFEFSIYTQGEKEPC